MVCCDIIGLSDMAQMPMNSRVVFMSMDLEKKIVSIRFDDRKEPSNDSLDVCITEMTQNAIENMMKAAVLKMMDVAVDENGN